MEDHSLLGNGKSTKRLKKLNIVLKELTDEISENQLVEGDFRDRFKKTVRIKEQNEQWDKLEAEGGIVPEWHRNSRKKASKKKAPKKNVQKKVSKKKVPKKKVSKKKK